MRQGLKEMREAVSWNARQARQYGAAAVAGVEDIARSARRGDSPEDIAQQEAWTVEDARHAARYGLRAIVGVETLAMMDRAAALRSLERFHPGRRVEL